MPNSTYDHKRVYDHRRKGFVSSITSIGLHLVRLAFFCQVDLTAVAGSRREAAYAFTELSGWLLLSI